MCSICGGTKWNRTAQYIFVASRDRGRDSEGKRILQNNGPWIGNHRAIPTTEMENPVEDQPVGSGPWYVFNGMIANDDDLGIRDGEADTSVLPRVLDPSSLISFHCSLSKLRGSFAIGRLDPNGDIFLACNYKPIWILEHEGEFYFSSLQNHFPPELRMQSYRMQPYSVRSLSDPTTTIDIHRNQHDPAIVICSSGLDSTAVAAYAVKKHRLVSLIHFDYGCRATRMETDRIPKIADRLGCSYEVLKIPSFLFGFDSPLLGNGEISEGKTGVEYAYEWVPARNLVMLSLAVAYAESRKYGHIYLGTNLEESGAYPDNEEQFLLDFRSLLWGAVNEGIKIEIHSPLGGLMKHEIVRFGMKYGAPFDLTWSCYRGGEKHCGTCGPCYMRRTAFERNGLIDPVFDERASGIV